MSKRYTVLGLSVFLALALAVPALGGPSNPVASISASVKQTANKALKKAKAAQKTANSANSTANSALGEAKKALEAAGSAKSTADTAKSTADTAKSTADSAKSTANSAKATAEAASAAAAAAEANANTRVKGSEQLAESTEENTSTNKFVSVSCPSGHPVLGGGFSVGGESQKVTVSASEEQLYGGGWFVIGNAISGTPSWSITAIAVCGTK
jgi:membrane protein involved in colicin uptake